MKILFFIMTLLCFGYVTNAQPDTTWMPGTTDGESLGDVVLDFCEVMPASPGGNDSLKKFIFNNLKYPPLALENDIEGVVYVSFVVEKDGTITDIKILKKPIGFGLEEETIRLVKLFPNYIPGMQNGNLVRARVKLPIKFKLK